MKQQESLVSSPGFKRKVLIGLMTVVLIILMFPKGESLESEVTEGTIWTNEDLIAPFSFPIIKDEAVYKAEIKAAENSVYPVFYRVDNYDMDSVKSYSAYFISTLDENLNKDENSIINPTFLSTKSFLKFLTIRKQQKELLRGKAKSVTNLLNSSLLILESLYKRGILNFQSNQQIKDSIAIRVGNIDRIEPKSKFYFLDEAKEEAEKRIKDYNYPEETESALIEFTLHFIEPDLIYNAEATKVEIEQAKNNVSKYTGIVNENERIIAKHDRITAQTKLKIESFKEAKGDSLGQTEIMLQMFGKFLHIAALLSLLSIYLYLFRKKIFFDNTKIVLIAILFILLSFVTYLINQISVEAPIHFLIFVPAASMILTIVFDSRVGFYSTIILALVTGALRGNDYTFMAMNLIAGGFSVYTVRDIKNRTQIFRSFLFILLGYTLSILAFGLERFAPVDRMILEFAFASSNALISPVLTYGLLIFFEKFFKITTDLTLLELSNFDRPLLRDLARKAPGTFNHSMTMGTIAEAAAEKIGANTLLARVGAYYHDVGKTISPQGFVENQMNNQNVHENLRPEESVQMIVRHVQEGIDLAKQENIPKELIDFIPMHHGTSTITYFYEKAKELYGEENVDVNDYKYPGPKPNTKETAIVMLADGCESAVRSIAEPDAQKVENMINNIFNARLKEGQLDDAPVSFSDLAKMKESFLSILISQHHRRIKYPKQEDAEKGIEPKDKK